MTAEPSLPRSRTESDHLLSGGAARPAVDCFSKRAHLRRPGQLIRSTRGADQDRLIGKIMGGNPAFRGTRVPVHLLAELVPSPLSPRWPQS